MPGWMARTYADDLATSDVLGSEPLPERPEGWPAQWPWNPPRPWLLQVVVEHSTHPTVIARCCGLPRAADKLVRFTGPLAAYRPNGRAFYVCTGCAMRLVRRGTLSLFALLTGLGASPSVASEIAARKGQT